MAEVSLHTGGRLPIDRFVVLFDAGWRTEQETRIGMAWGDSDKHGYTSTVRLHTWLSGQYRGGRADQVAILTEGEWLELERCPDPSATPTPPL